MKIFENLEISGTNPPFSIRYISKQVHNSQQAERRFNHE